MKTVGVVGSRSFRGYARMKEVLDALREEIGPFLILSGGAEGADLLAERYAREENDDLILIYSASWYDSQGRFDKTAGFTRNTILAQESELLVAFWDGDSKGTRDTIEKAERLGTEVRVELFSRPGHEPVLTKPKSRAQEAAILAAFDLGDADGRKECEHA